MKPSRLITFYKFLFASMLLCVFSHSFAREISELEEITMQVLEKESVETMEVQQMIRIPSPLAPSTSLHSNSGPEATLQSKAKPMSRSVPENTKTIQK